MNKFRKGDKVRVITDIASSVVMRGEVLEVGLVEVVDGKTVYYLHGGDDWCFKEHEIEICDE